MCGNIFMAFAVVIAALTTVSDIVQYSLPVLYNGSSVQWC